MVDVKAIATGFVESHFSGKGPCLIPKPGKDLPSCHENDYCRCEMETAFLAGVRYLADQLRARSWEIPMWIESGPHDGEIDPDNFIDWITTEYSCDVNEGEK